MKKKGGPPLKEYILHLPEEESILLSGAAAKRLLNAGDGDAALRWRAFSRRSKATGLI